jgi:uncharacterized protein
VTRWLWVLLVGVSAIPASRVECSDRLDVVLRGKTLECSLYQPRTEPKGTIIMGSGDVGWVGLGVDMAEYLVAQGYIVVGVNVRQYLAGFARPGGQLTVEDPPADYAALADVLKQKGLLKRPTIVSGVSEGAALAVLVASASSNHTWVTGVISMGVPPLAELAWRWSDFTSWITKRDAREPSFAAADFVAAVSPLPIVMLQSTKDEYVTPADWQRLFEAAREPKKLVLIDASNHRFTDRRDDLRREYMSALAWIASQPAK